MATEEELEQQEEPMPEASPKQSQKVRPRDPEGERARRLAEQMLNEAKEAIQQAVQARARLYASAPLDHAQARLEAAQDHFEAGAYADARTVAQQALSSADQALGHALNMQQKRREQQKRCRIVWFYAILGLLVVGLGGRWAVQSWRSRSAGSSAVAPPAPTEAKGGAKAQEPVPVPDKEPASPTSANADETPETPSGPGPEKTRPERFVTVQARYLNVREGSGTDFPVQQRVYRGQKLGVLQEKEGWLRVDLGDGKTGWVIQRLTREVSEP